MDKLAIVISETGRTVVGTPELDSSGIIKKDISGFSRISDVLTFVEIPQSKDPFDTKLLTKPIYNSAFVTEIYMKVVEYAFIDDPVKFGHLHEKYSKILNKTKETLSDRFKEEEIK